MRATPLVLCAADDRQVGHAHLPDGRFFDQAHAANAIVVVGVLRSHLVEKAAIDLVDDFQVPRQ